jgi:hypothetical protein
MINVDYRALFDALDTTALALSSCCSMPRTVRSTNRFLEINHACVSRKHGRLTRADSLPEY